MCGCASDTCGGCNGDTSVGDGSGICAGGGSSDICAGGCNTTELEIMIASKKINLVIIDCKKECS